MAIGEAEAQSSTLDYRALSIIEPYRLSSLINRACDGDRGGSGSIEHAGLSPAAIQLIQPIDLHFRHLRVYEYTDCSRQTEWIEQQHTD
jgi:hypothetical protein